MYYYAPPLLAIPLALGLVVFSVILQVICAIVCLFERNATSVRKATSGQFLVSCVDAFTQTIFAVLYTLTGSIAGLLTGIFWVLALIALGSLVYVTYEQAPSVWTDMARSYNGYLGPFIHGTIVNILYLTNTLYRGIIPLWNGIIFFVSQLFQGYLVPTAITESSTIVKLGTFIFSLAKHLSYSCFQWISAVVVDCPVANGDACFDVAGRTFDLMTPMADLRGVVIQAVALSGRVCGFASPIVDILTYPFMDINFASAVHKIVNAVIYAPVQLAHVTYLRCDRHGGESLLMCTPDMEPAITFLTSGFRDMGYFFNNWINIIYVIVQGALGFEQISCTPQLAPSSLDPGPLRAALFGANNTIIIGLTGWLMAVTDGLTVAYQGQGSTRIASWPSYVNISHGVAAVAYGKSSDRDVTSLSAAGSGTSTSIFGCSCGTDGVQMQIRCSVLPFSGLLASESGDVPVIFQQGSLTEKSLKCSDIDIFVQSVRWPASRFSTTASGNLNADCATSKTCSKVDATVWVVPRDNCDSESTVCDCYPYCMGIRLAGSQASSIILYSAESWKSKVYAVQRDCNIHSLGTTFDATVSNAVQDAGITTTQSGSTQFVGRGSTLDASSCVDSFLVTSIINRTLHPAYSNPTQAYLRNRATPFVISGDTVLTSIKHGDGTYSVRVERLTGASNNEFTLSTVSENFPAYPPPSVPSSIFTKYPKDKLTTPYARQATLAVSTRNYVFYAVNPAIEVFSAYLNYCKNNANGNSIDQFGLIMVSSYSPIRIWRVDAYRRCGITGCGSDLVKQVDIPGAFSDGTLQGTEFSYECTKAFNDVITSIEYVNDLNIAVTVRHTNVAGTLKEYWVYWLNPDTMQLRGPGVTNGVGPWVDEIPKTALSAYSLCPSMQRLPLIGSLFAELAIAKIFLVKLPLDAIVYFPGIVKLWSSGSVCPLQTRGHSILQDCGANAFLLNEFFDSLQTATNVFWSSLAFLSRAMHKAEPDSDTMEFVQNVLNGISRYGVGSIDLWTARFQILEVMKAGPETIMDSMPTEVIISTDSASKWAQGALKVSSNTLGWARFGYTSMVKITMTITQNVLTNRAVGTFEAWRIALNVLDEMRDDFDTHVMDNLRQSCAGISLILGVGNPWAVFIYQQCIAANEATQSALDLFMSLFNLAPFSQCMCSNSAGKVFGEYAMKVCVPKASARLRPILLEMVQASKDAVLIAGTLTRGANPICQRMLAYTKTQVTNSVEPWFDAQFKSMDALAASLDYSVAWFDPSAGQCLNYYSDPNVVVLLPYPIDYFQACGSTSLCRSKCSGVWDAFDAALAGVSDYTYTRKVTIQAESLFFPTMSEDAFMPMKVFTLMQPGLATCTQTCGQPNDSCIAVSGVKAGAVVVQYYCTPRMVSASVYRTVDSSLEWHIEESRAWSNDIVQLQFADKEGRFLVVLTSTGQVYMASPLSNIMITDINGQSDEIEYQVLRLAAIMVIFNDPYASISLHVLYRLLDGKITAKPIHRTLTIDTSSFPPATGDLARWITHGNMPFFSDIAGYAVVQTPNPLEFALFPRTDGQPVQVLTITWDSTIKNGIVKSSIKTLASPSGMGSLIANDQPVSQNCKIDSEGAYVAFVVAPEFQSTSWLSQIRISTAYASAFSSQPVQVDVETIYDCGVDSCIGCPDGEVQRLCDAVQQCAVINCIGTPVNMRRVLCQMGETIADETRENLALLHGTWTVFVDMLMVILDLSLQKGLTGINLSWPDDRFFGYVCTIKDRNAHIISIFTSSINSVLQLGHSSLVYLEGRAPDIDSNFNAMSTIPITALTSLLHQAFLAPVYPMIVAQKVMMCRVQGVLAIFDSTGFKLTVGNVAMQAASDSAVGHCLTANFVTRNANPQDSENSQSTGRIVAQISQSAAMSLLPQLTFQGQTLETTMHIIDAQLSYIMGIVSGLEDVLQSIDMTHCKLPDYYLNETVLCSCGDAPFQIPPTRRTEGLTGVGLWCTGTLSLLDASNRPYIIYNPYTYQELQDLAWQTDAYLACASSKIYVAGDPDLDCHSLRPSAPLLQSQGVSVLTVLTTCKNNYMKKQWDPVAHILFNRSLFDDEVTGISYPSLDILSSKGQTVGKCLADVSTRTVCLQYYLASINQDPVTYWSYQDMAVGPSQKIDACMTFTGPARNPDLTLDQMGVFRACLDQYSEANCQLSSSLWTPQSDNAVPVAYTHAVKLTRPDSLDMVVQLKFSQAREMVMSALSKLQNYNNRDVLTIFFSPEGDIMHQMMDCVFMGPYNKVNYWPTDSLGRLAVPVWYRDSDGTSRSIDPRVCVKSSVDKLPPYSCGSETRKAVIKYFFRDYLPQQQNATLSSIVGAMVADLTLAWNNSGNYSCLCPDEKTHNLTCCSLNSSSWLPGNLDTVFQTIPANHVLRALTSQLQEFYRYSLEVPEVWTKYLNNVTFDSYDWTVDPRATVAVTEALFKADKPVIKYDSSEVNSPLSGGSALWQQCHGALSNIFFTIPLGNTSSGQWMPKNLPDKLEGTDGLDAFIKSAVYDSFIHSPLYRHYNVSYVPSESKLCTPLAPTTKTATSRTKVRVSTYSTVFTPTSWPTLPVYGPSAFPLHGCFCGWDGDGVTCTPPAIVCKTLPSACPTFKARDTVMISTLKNSWNASSWPCPSLDISDQWSITDSGESDRWLTGDFATEYSLYGEDLLRRGRSGLRVGNFQSLPAIAKANITPAQRVFEPMNSAIPMCESGFASKVKGQPLTDTTALRAFVTGLFPVAQGVYEASAPAYCLRYTVESALLTAMELVESQWDSGVSTANAAQRQTANIWRAKCESQISLLALCKNLDVFKPPVNPKLRKHPCPFSINAREDNDVYMTPGCLVHNSGSFYNPCKCASFTCGPTKPRFTDFSAGCKIAFDPRDMTTDAPLGGWTVSAMDVLKPDFASTITGNGEALGNVKKGGNWAKDEGKMNETGLHCDMLTDWWPTGQTLPVGYHATTPCTSDETGYRTFDSAFAVERTTTPGQYTVVKMVYQNDLTRDATKIDTHLGAGGICSASNFGMPFFQTNTMRVCTRQLSGSDTLDPAIPVTYPDYVDGLYGPEVCSADSEDVPWYPLQDRQDSALHSVGTVPNMPTDTSADSTYPPTERYFGIGPQRQILEDIAAFGQGWGTGCSDYELKECSSDLDCPSSQFYCLTTAKLCMHNDFRLAANGHCYRHDQCLGDMMCDGTGTCVPGSIVYLNTLNGSIETTVFSELCDEVTSNSYPTDGSSPWEYVSDWLEGHGMCSNKNWYMYNINNNQAKQAKCSGSCSGTSCSFNARTCTMGVNSTLWWPPEQAEPKIFPVKPTICDRDYEHMRGPSGSPMYGCAPKRTVTDNAITDAFSVKSPIAFARLFRNYATDGTTRLAQMPFTGLKKTGFLGQGESGLSPTTVVNCEGFSNCYAYKFTFNGIVKSPRTFWPKDTYLNKATPYNEVDIFRCGVTGYYDESSLKCKLDLKVVPLYVALCKTDTLRDKCACTTPIKDGIGCTPVIVQSRTKSICSNIQQEYTADYFTIQSNVKNLQDLFTVFTASEDTLVSHISGSECFEGIYGNMQASGKQYYDSNMPAAGVYYPFEFALFEVPLAWIYQCVRLGGLQIDQATTRITCNQYESAKSLATAASYSSDQAAFNFDTVQGSYNRSALVQAKEDYITRLISAIPLTSEIEEFKSKCGDMGVTPENCKLLPYCATRRDWLPISQFTSDERPLLASIYNGLCQKLVKEYQLKTVLEMTFEEYLGNKTTLHDFQLESRMTARDPVDAFIKTALRNCVNFVYSPTTRWPISISFDASNTVSCMDLIGTVNNFETGLITTGDYNDGNTIYMPGEDIPQTVGLGTPGVVDNCVFTTLYEQNLFKAPDAVEVPGVFLNGRAGNDECLKFPSVFSKGQQNCKYPMAKTYTGLLSHVSYVWSKMLATFQTKYQSLPSFSMPEPSQPAFFQSSSLYFPTGWTYNTMDLRKYLSNIHPDTSKEIMCTLTSDKIDFTTCNDQNYATLQAHTENVRQDGPSILPSGSQLHWKVSQAFMARGALFAFANNTRPDEQVLLKSTFNNATRCGIDESPYNRVCLQKQTGSYGDNVRPWVPWMSGEWNPFEFCDVRLLELNQGNQEEIWPYDTSTCPQCDALNGEYRSTYMFDAQTPNCNSRKNTFAKIVDVDPTGPTNLCYIRTVNSDSDCTHAQGMVGGGRGRSVLNHPFIPHLYGYNNISGSSSSGIYPRGNNKIFQGNDSDTGEYGYLSIPGDEIGVTCIGLQIDPVDTGIPYLRVARLPLQPQASSGYMPSWKSREASAWVPTLAETFAAEDALHAIEQQARGNSKWDCPMRRVAFYSQGWDEFSTAVPSPGRSRRLFGNLTGGKSSHPTQILQRDGSALGNYTTSNGFCFCPANMPSTQLQCRIALSDSTHPCSLKKTVDALQGSYTLAYAFQPQSAGGGAAPCQMQFDWPYLKGTLRDGTEHSGSYTYASDPLAQKCHLLDRLKPFKYRYKSDTSFQKKTGTTLDKGGVCHTGRAAVLTAEAKARMTTTRCVKKSEDDAGISVSCEDGTQMTLSKEKSSPLTDMVNAAKLSRTKCDQCSPSPSFVNSKGQAIPAESSFGIPFRFSASRAIAADLRKLLCKDFANETTCAVKFNSDKWTSDLFLTTLISNPASLFIGATAKSTQTKTTTPDPAWASTASNWVFCNSTDALKSGKCKGAIPESAWRADRFQSCYKTTRELTRDDPDVMSSVDVCLIDSNLQDLCTAIKQAQILVKQANCLASGSETCALKPFLYQPSTWDVSNNAFVHDTVKQFYTRVTTYACPATIDVIRTNNQAIMSRCAATPVGAIRLGLQGCRNVVDAMAQLFFYASSILIEGLLMAFDSDKSTRLATIVFYWNSMVAVVKDLFLSLSDIFFDMLFRMGPLGTKIYAMTRKSCSYINTGYRYWLTVWCGIAIDLLPMVLAAVRQLTEFSESTFGFLNDAMDTIFQYLVPDALGALIGMGYDKTFRNKDKSAKARQKQVIKDKLKESKLAGKKADAAAEDVKNSNIDKYALNGRSRGSNTGKKIYRKIAGVGSAVLGAIGGGLLEVASVIYDEIEENRLADLYPDNWTLYDFDSVYTVLDTFEYFISNDDNCLEYRMYDYPELLNCTFPSLASKDSLAGAMSKGTRCWADAQRNIGTSNLLACSPSDTCYRSIYDLTPIICASCPDAGQGFSQYGCSPITKICTCSVATTQTTRCTSHDQCAYASSTCSLITGLDDMSYGNQPCTHCTKEVQCIVRGGDGIGQCGCVFQMQPVQECTQPPGQFVEITSPYKMCGYISNADLSQSMAIAHWDSMALVQCIYLRPAYVYCTRVYRDSKVISMAVGLSMASVSQSFQSRRLLVDGSMLPEGPFEIHSAESEYALPDTQVIHKLLEEDWNATAAPCSALVSAYQESSRSVSGAPNTLGPLDTMALHECAYWRFIGRKTIERYNLTSLAGHDGFLLSVDDFASALAQRSVLVDLLKTPESLVFALGHAPVLKPLYAAILVVKSLAIMKDVDKFGLTLSTESLHESWDKAWETAKRLSIFSMNKTARPEKQKKEKFENHTNSTKFKKPGQRKLLQSTTNLKLAQSWLSGPFTWPPNYLYDGTYAQCNAGSAIVHIIFEITSVLVKYYYNLVPQTPTPPRTLRENLPKFPPGSAVNPNLTPVKNQDSWTKWVYHSVFDLLGFDATRVRSFFRNEEGTTNFFTVYTSMLKCDFPAVQYCSNHRKDLLATIALYIILYFIVAYMSNLIGFPIAGTALVLVIAPLILWYAYGQAFTCSPMLPTCLLDDVIAATTYMFPKSLTIPPELEISPNCLGDSTKSACLKQCSEPPMNFLSWRDTLAFGLCYMDTVNCRWLAAQIGQRDPISDILYSRANSIDTAPDSLTSANLFCFSVTFVTLLPVLILVILALSSAAYLLYLPCVLIPKLITVALQAVILVHITE